MATQHDQLKYSAILNLDPEPEILNLNNTCSEAKIYDVMMVIISYALSISDPDFCHQDVLNCPILVK